VKKRIIAFFSAAVMVLSLLSGCSGGSTTQITDLASPVPIDEKLAENFDGRDFSAALFKETAKGENPVISPLSVICALAMTTNGADGVTREQMEDVLGMTADEMNAFFAGYMNDLPESEKCKLKMANSIWMRDEENRLTVNESFLATADSYYNAAGFKAPFDNATLRDINKWIEEGTDGTIKDMLSRISDDAVMYIINALCFDARWAEQYHDYQIRKAEFTNADGSKRQVFMMYSGESVYLEHEGIIGVMKPYSGGRFSFAAFLPPEGTDIHNFINSLDGEAFAAILDSASFASVNTAIPKFTFEYSSDIAETLSSIGMKDLFSPDECDLSGIGESARGNLFVSAVLHNAYISVDENGTKAGAATIVEVADAASAEITQPKTVTLDRPFVYVIYDTQYDVPLFIGAVTSME